MIVGALTTLLVFVISWWMILIIWFPPFYDLAIFLLAKKLQGEGFHRHLQQGGQQHTHLRVLLLGISFLIALLILFTITVVIVVTAMAWADITT